MAWFYNLSISKKLLYSFSIVTLISVIIGYIGYTNINSISESSMDLGENKLPGVQNLLQINAAQMGILLGERGLIIRRYTGERRIAQYGWIEAQYKRIDEGIKEFELLTKNDDEIKSWNNFKSINTEFKKLDDQLVALSKEKDILLAQGLAIDDPAIATIDDKVLEISFESRAKFLECDKIIMEMINKTKENAKETVANISSESTNANFTMILFIIIGVIISILFGYFISKIISNPLKRAVFVLTEMSKGHLDERMDLNWKDELGEMANTMDEFSINLDKFVNSMHKVANGDLTIHIPLSDAKDKIAPGLNIIVDSLNKVKSEIDNVTKNALEGKLNVRGKSELFNGGYKEIISGFNETLEAIVIPLQETQKVLTVLSTKDLRVTIDKQFKGDFELLRRLYV